MSTYEVTVTVDNDRSFPDAVQAVLFALTEQTDLTVVAVTGAVNV